MRRYPTTGERASPPSWLSPVKDPSCARVGGKPDADLDKICEELTIDGFHTALRTVS